MVTKMYNIGVYFYWTEERKLKTNPRPLDLLIMSQETSCLHYTVLI